MIEFRGENLILGDDRDKEKGGSPSFPRVSFAKKTREEIKRRFIDDGQKMPGEYQSRYQFFHFSIFICRIAVNLDYSKIKFDNCRCEIIRTYRWRSFRFPSKLDDRIIKLVPYSEMK